MGGGLGSPGWTFTFVYHGDRFRVCRDGVHYLGLGVGMCLRHGHSQGVGGGGGGHWKYINHTPPPTTQFTPLQSWSTCPFQIVYKKC